jgi:GWxTD domain-containing protein
VGPWSLLVLWPLIAGFWPVFGSDPLQETFPIEGRGNIPFQADVARFRGPDGPVVEVALSIPRDDRLAAGDSARLAVQIEPLDRRKRALGRFRTEVKLPPAEAREAGGFPVPRGWLRLSPRWVEGTVGLRVRVENLDRLKRGLYDRIRSRHLDGEAAARIVSAGEAVAPGRLSDLLFAWGANATVDAAEAGEPGGGLRAIRARLEPNPYRYYGLFQPVLTVYWERYPGEGEDTGAVVETRRILHLPDSLQVIAERDTLAASTEPSWMLRRYDLSGLPGGAYRLEVTLQRPDGNGGPLARTAGAFQVVWEERNWLRGEAELLDIARVILPSPEYERFEQLDRGGQETFFREFWNRRAPAEAGAVNSLEQLFEERRAHADDFFRGQRSGMLSDRGRVYIRLGPPDEVRAQLNPHDDQLLWLALPQETDATGELGDEARQRLSKRRNRFDNSAYEVWEYTTRGAPLLPEYINPGQGLGMKFIFVDELGTGDYTLAYTNAPGTLQ